MSSASNIALKVPFSEKDQAKSLGARWNAESKHWYVPQGVDAKPFEKWFSNPSLSSTSAQATPASTANMSKSTLGQSMDDDLDAINAELRNAYESRDIDVF